jgi:GGDEF domain-containing protein
MVVIRSLLKKERLRKAGDMGILHREHDCEWRERALALEAELQRLRERVAVEDPQSGLGNEAQFRRDATKLMARRMRGGTPFTVVIFDALLAGRSSEGLDAAVVEGIAAGLVEMVRTEDSVARLAERRFGILLAGSTEDAARGFVERARGRLSQLRDDEGHFVMVSLVAGVAEWKPEMKGGRALMAAALADLERYRAEYGRERSRFAATG